MFRELGWKWSVVGWDGVGLGGVGWSLWGGVGTVGQDGGVGPSGVSGSAPAAPTPGPWLEVECGGVGTVGWGSLDLPPQHHLRDLGWDNEPHLGGGRTVLITIDPRDRNNPTGLSPRALIHGRLDSGGGERSRWSP